MQAIGGGHRWLTFCKWIASAGIVLAAIALAGAASGVRAASPDFQREIAPLLIKRCLECHRGGEPAGGLDLSTAAGLRKGGDSRAVIAPGQPDKSHLLARVRAGEMPPRQQGKARSLPAAEVELLESWIAAGANWPAQRVLDLFETSSDVRAGRDWWSLQPVRRPAVPNDAEASGLAPIDAFIAARQRANGLEPAPPADRRTLLRRVTWDLVGLPPTPDELQSFLRDTSPAAWERVVDRLLASPHYGERWGRFWLDLVRYAETCGYERDQEKTIRLAVPRLGRPSLEFGPAVRPVRGRSTGRRRTPQADEQSVIATGFLRLGTWNDEPNDPQEYKYERLEDMVHATSSTFLGLTVKCARCHDHKFDPIRQVDYYRMAAAFWAGPIEPADRKLLGGPTAAQLGFDNVLGWTDTGPRPSPLRLLKKGNPKHLGEEVPPAHLSLLPALNRPIQPPPADARTSQRRLQLARWIVDPDNPLTARVFVNRVWQHHFGRGLVRTPNNFGFRGSRPTHPKLLDWLADDFRRHGWRIKRLHKQILMSRTYRQSAEHPNFARMQEIDGGNLYWWRTDRRRLDAETLRDAMLFVAGRLDRRRGGPSFKPTISDAALEGPLAQKRSVGRLAGRRTTATQLLHLHQARTATSADDHVRLRRHHPALRTTRRHHGRAASPGPVEQPLRSCAEHGAGNADRRRARASRRSDLGRLDAGPRSAAASCGADCRHPAPGPATQPVRGRRTSRGSRPPAGVGVALPRPDQQQRIPVHRLTRILTDFDQVPIMPDQRQFPCGQLRREFLWEMGAGFAGTALTGLLAGDGFFTRAAWGQEPAPANDPLAVRPPHFPTKAKACIFLIMNGGPSQVDTFDPKPELARYAGKTLPADKKYINSGGRKVGYLTPAWRKFRPGGESGLLISDYFPQVRKHADKLAILNSCHTDSHAHGSALVAMNTGKTFIGRPSLGSWCVYGLGTANQNLPGYVVMLDKRGGPISGQPNWSSGFMPSTYAGTLFRPSGDPILDLRGPTHVTRQAQRAQLDLLVELNRQHRALRADGRELEARTRSYELAFRMQAEAPEAVDLSQETAATLAAYGVGQAPTDEYGRNCLIARRLVERGVRFVQLYSGGGHLEETWDAHESIEKNHGRHAAEVDQADCRPARRSRTTRSAGQYARALGRRVRTDALQ